MPKRRKTYNERMRGLDAQTTPSLRATLYESMSRQEKNKRRQSKRKQRILDELNRRDRNAGSM
jgi:hypothetical protein